MGQRGQVGGNRIQAPWRISGMTLASGLHRLQILLWGWTEGMRLLSTWTAIQGCLGASDFPA